MKRLALHWQIILGMVLGIVAGLLFIQFSGGGQFVKDWIKPFGTIFINALKLIAVPLIVASLIKGVSDLKDISKLSLMGGRTIGLYLFTTVFAVSIGLLAVNVIKPGKLINEQTRDQLVQNYAGDAGGKIAMAAEQKSAGPLQALVDLVPGNIFNALSDNGSMLQVIFFVLFFGVALILIPEEKATPVKNFFDGLNDTILKMIDLIMLAAPLGVFALMAALVAESPSADIFKALIGYALTVLLGLGILIGFFYPFIMRTVTGKSLKFFFNGIAPAQLLAFSTSSSAATLPVTMERVEEHLGVDKEVTSLGAQLGIVATATLASIGTAAVPSAGMVMLVIILGQAGIPEAGLALIFAVDRPLDMCRTVANITGDATVSMVVAKSLDKLGEPNVKNWDDNYEIVK